MLLTRRESPTLENFLDYHNWLSMLQIFFQAVRPKTLSASVIPVITGSSVAYANAHFSWGIFLLTLIAALLIQIGTNFANDLYDFINGADNEDRIGPARVTQSGLLSISSMKVITAFIFFAAICCGYPLVIRGGFPVLCIGLVSIISGYLYTAGPYPLGYNGLGDIFVFIFFGPIAVCGTYFLQTHNVTNFSLLCGIICGLLSVVLLCVNNLRDIDTDRESGKKTLAVRFGFRFVQAEFILILIFIYIISVVLYLNASKLSLLITLLTVPISINLINSIIIKRGAELNDMLGSVSRFMLIHSCLLIIGILL